MAKEKIINKTKKVCNLCKPINHEYKKGFVYILMFQQFTKQCKPKIANLGKYRYSIILKSNKKKNNYGINDCLSSKQMLGIGSKFKLICPLKMGEIDGIARKKLPSTCKVVKFNKLTFFAL